MKSTNATLGDCLDSGETIRVYCEDTFKCGHGGKVDIEKLAAKYGRDYGALHYDLIKLPWICQKCGGRKVSFRYQPGTKEYGYQPPMNTVEEFRKADEEKAKRK